MRQQLDGPLLAPHRGEHHVHARIVPIVLHVWARLAPMSRIALVLMVVIGAGGCGDEGNGRITDPCTRFTSCGSCTPVRGCGWCAHGQDGGICLSDPLSCPGPKFTWTWEPSACTAEGDAGATPPDAGATDAQDGPGDN